MTSSLAVIILAAGLSKRMGQPKQLLPFKNSNLLQHTIDEANSTGLYPVIIVVKDQVAAPQIKEGNFLLQNEEAETGMAGSLVQAMHLLQTIAPGASGVLILVCDQPYLSRDILHSLVEKFETTSGALIASSYQGTFGTPAIIGTKYFGELLLLTGDSGAKRIMKAHVADLELVDFPGGEIDIDTPEDWNKFIGKG